ncbi:hypothetical protein [Pantoea anthophila]|uniref:hypothetical protein n=1 Tax=Pantoea anthophila TaxID=470931 RepID=UPI00128C13C1|nr:hypothetical protein [Pantoea anthophila]
MQILISMRLILVKSVDDKPADCQAGCAGKQRRTDEASASPKIRRTILLTNHHASAAFSVGFIRYTEEYYLFATAMLNLINMTMRRGYRHPFIRRPAAKPGKMR